MEGFFLVFFFPLSLLSQYISWNGQVNTLHIHGMWLRGWFRMQVWVLWHPKSEQHGLWVGPLCLFTVLEPLQTPWDEPPGVWLAALFGFSVASFELSRGKCQHEKQTERFLFFSPFNYCGFKSCNKGKNILPAFYVFTSQIMLSSNLNGNL